METGGTDTEEPASGEEFIFGLAAYLLTSARGCVDEPKMYGPLRLVDAISRLATISEHARCLGRDEFLQEAKRKIDTNKQLVMESEEEFTKFLDQMIKEFTSELKKREGLG